MSKSQTPGLWRRLIEKKNLTLWCLDIMRPILTSHLKVIKTPQNVHKMCFWCVLMTFICEVKIDLIMSRHHYVKFFFSINLLHSSSFWLFDIWQIIGKLLRHFNRNFNIFINYIFRKVVVGRVQKASPWGNTTYAIEFVCCEFKCYERFDPRMVCSCEALHQINWWRTPGSTRPEACLQLWWKWVSTRR